MILEVVRDYIRFVLRLDNELHVQQTILEKHNYSGFSEK